MEIQTDKQTSTHKAKTRINFHLPTLTTNRNRLRARDMSSCWQVGVVSERLSETDRRCEWAHFGISEQAAERGGPARHIALSSRRIAFCLKWEYKWKLNWPFELNERYGMKWNDIRWNWIKWNGIEWDWMATEDKKKLCFSLAVSWSSPPSFRLLTCDDDDPNHNWARCYIINSLRKTHSSKRKLPNESLFFAPAFPRHQQKDDWASWLAKSNAPLAFCK